MLRNGACVPLLPSADAQVSNESDAGIPADSALDSGEPLPKDDPCPAVGPDGTSVDGGTYVINCDALCGPLFPYCDDTRCRRSGEARSNPQLASDFPPQVAASRSTIIRIPRDPWRFSGECDPSTSIKDADPTLDPYLPMIPQPRYAFIVGVDRTMPETFRAKPGAYSMRLLTMARTVNRTPTATMRSSRFEPLAKPGEFGPAERDQTGCAILDLGALYQTQYKGINVCLPGFASIVFHTNAAHVGATNLEVNNTGVPCE
ncbi:MAG: hypothetical protein HOO96_36530 [Polyangiaceae bacterium]|nr:hypothetical protein [Polyangiaceae bacterium]